MHIKQVIVEGFKTYREQTAADFEPHLNCIGTYPRPDLPVGTPHPPRRKQPPHFEIPPSPAVPPL